MDAKEINDHIAATHALIAENERLMAHQAEVFAEVRTILAEQQGCSEWDLERLLERDLSAEDRAHNEQAALALLQQMAPALDDQTLAIAQGGGSNAPPPASASGAPRPRRRMV